MMLIPAVSATRSQRRRLFSAPRFGAREVQNQRSELQRDTRDRAVAVVEHVDLAAGRQSEPTGDGEAEQRAEQLLVFDRRPPLRDATHGPPLLLGWLLAEILGQPLLDELDRDGGRQNAGTQLVVDEHFLLEPAMRVFEVMVVGAGDFQLYEPTPGAEVHAFAIVQSTVQLDRAAPERTDRLLEPATGNKPLVKSRDAPLGQANSHLDLSCERTKKEIDRTRDCIDTFAENQSVCLGRRPKRASN